MTRLAGDIHVLLDVIGEHVVEATEVLDRLALAIGTINVEDPAGKSLELSQHKTALDAELSTALGRVCFLQASLGRVRINVLRTGEAATTSAAARESHESKESGGRGATETGNPRS
jgi:hypothetical protein